MRCTRLSRTIAAVTTVTITVTNRHFVLQLRTVQATESSCEIERRLDSVSNELDIPTAGDRSRDLYRAFIFYSASFMTKTLVVNNATIKFNVWDTAGQEKVCVLIK